MQAILQCSPCIIPIGGGIRSLGELLLLDMIVVVVVVVVVMRRRWRNSSSSSNEKLIIDLMQLQCSRRTGKKFWCF
jgi:hypothetical protein